MTTMMMGGIGGDSWKKIVREGVPRPYLPVEGRGKSRKKKNQEMAVLGETWAISESPARLPPRSGLELPAPAALI